MYDYERWLSERFKGKAAIITPEYLLLELQKLQAHIAVIDVYRMNKQLLHQYLLFLLQDEKIGIIQRKAPPGAIRGLVTAFLEIVALLPPYFALEVLGRLQVITEGYPAEQQKVSAVLQAVLRKKRWQQYFPWLALLLVLFLCFAMYCFAKR